MKRHRERLMLYHKEHVKTLDEQSIGEAYMLLLTIGRKYFSHADQWAVFEPVYASPGTLAPSRVGPRREH
ncbi:hypothetical protein E6H15_02115 [Candidatus Bathyarchaeota archaeon]|nr:MAG: hypothetical protein E6H15_02115 [Candidatus Bathyarchaeota archaeon]